MLPIRANANVPVNENNPSSARELLAYYNLEQYEKALEHVQKSYSIDAENPVIVEHLADILKATDQVSKANIIYMQAINVGGDSLSIQQKINIE